MLKFWSKLRLLTKLSLMILTIIIVTIGSFYLMSRQLNKEAVLETESTHLLNIAQTIGNQYIVIDALTANTSSPELQAYAQSFEEQFKLDYVVAINIDSIRLTHPDKSLIYEKFAGGDEQAAFDGEMYVSTGSGTLGTSLRAFVPVYNEEEVIGAVVVGKTNHSLALLNQKFDQQITLGLIISLVIGLFLATLVAYSIKRQLFNMEPEEIAQRFEERTAMFEYSHDSVIVTNQTNHITLANTEAVQHFGIRDIKNLPTLNTVFPGMNSTSRTNSVLKFNDKDYIFSQAPIIVGENLVGRIYIIRDATEVYTLLNQLYSTSEYAHLLQVQAHEFLNRLHVIYGLTDLEEYKELKNYLESLINQETDLTVRISMMVHNPVIAGQLIGQSRRLIQSLPEVTINVLAEIPNTNQTQVSQTWIDINEVIHDEIINKHTKLDLRFEIDYQASQLITHYYFTGETTALFTWLMKQPWKIDVDIELDGTDLHLAFSIDYEERYDEI